MQATCRNSSRRYGSNISTSISSNPTRTKSYNTRSLRLASNPAHAHAHDHAQLSSNATTRPLQTRQYAHSRYPDRRNRFTRSNSLQTRSIQHQEAHLLEPQQQQHQPQPPIPHQPQAQIPDDPNGVLTLNSNNGAAILLSQSALIVTREIEMMNIFLGFEQANRYALLSPQGEKVGYLMEEETGILGGSIQRQLLKTHRPFKASVLDLEGKVILRISRGVTLINSKTRIWSIDGDQEKLIGEVVQNFHVWRRKYELFRSISDQTASNTTFNESDNQSKEDNQSKDLIPINKQSSENLDQFAKIDSGLLSWDFLLQDQNGDVLGAINRNFRGFGRELFTDTGQYVVRFRDIEPNELHTPARLIETSSGKAIAATPPSDSSSSKELILSQQSRPLTLDERAIALACSISIDFDYFSRHSSSGGGFMPFFWMGGGSSPPPPEGDTESPSTTTTGQDSSGIQSSPEFPGSDGGIGSGAATTAGYGMMGGGGSQSSDSSPFSPSSDSNSNSNSGFPDSGFSDPPPPEAGTQSDGWGFGSRQEQGMGQDEEVWGGGENDPWSESTQGDGEGGGGLFSGWGLSDFLGGDD